MKDQGLCSVHIGPTNKHRNISGPVAILMQTETHFLGAYVGANDRLMLELLPKAFIGSTVWPRHYPFSEKLIALVEKLDEGNVLMMPTPPVRPTVEGTVREEVAGLPTRVYGSAGDGRRTAIVGGGSGVYPGYTGGYNHGQSVLEDVRNLAGVTKDKLAQVKAGEDEKDEKTG